MNEDAAVALSMLSTIIAWSLALLWVAEYLDLKIKNRFVSHLLGAVIGFGAAFGAFCLSGALFLPSTHDDNTTIVGNIGAAILLAYWVAYLFAKRSLVRVKQNKTIDHAAIKKKKADARAQQEKVLGMSFSDFYSERAESHAIGWLVIFFFAAVIYVAVFMLSDSNLDLFTRFLLGFVGVTLVATLYVLSCLLIVPVIFILLALFPFISLIIYLEAWLRVRENIPYVSPILDSHALSELTSASSTNNHWVFPFAMGLWLGHMWGDDD